METTAGRHVLGVTEETMLLGKVFIMVLANCRGDVEHAEDDAEDEDFMALLVMLLLADNGCDAELWVGEAFRRLASFSAARESWSLALLMALALPFLDELWPRDERYDGLSSVVDLSLLNAVLIMMIVPD